MKLTIAIITSAALALCACGDQAPQSGADTAAGPDATTPWPEFVESTIAAYYEANPEVAVDAGKHEYDGVASDLSLEAAAAYVEWIDRTIAAAQDYKALAGIEAFERDYLVQALRGERFTMQDSGFLQNNPVFYIRLLGFGVYVDRKYAPVDERIATYTDYISQVPRMLAQMRVNLEPPLPEAYVVTAEGMFTGLADYLEGTVPGLFAEVEDAGLQQRFSAANSAAVKAAEETAAWLESQRAASDDNFALGADRFLSMLRAAEGVDIPLADLKAAGEADLERNLAALRATCDEFLPGASVRDCVLEVQANKPPEGAVAGARRQLPALREFMVAEDLVSIPGTEDALVDEAPPHRRTNAAYINIPGPFESGLPSVYYIAPADPTWSEEDQLAYVPGETSLLAISVHEVWPGHFLQFLHANRARNRVGRHFSTYSFVEGWAHYTEEMMIEAGLGDGDPEVRIGQLLNALLRNVRYLSAIGLHAERMTVAESQAMFEEKAFQDFGNAMQQANRGTYDPGYLNYTLGKLMIMKLREDWTADRGGREAWKSFHDRFLSYGSPPIPLVRKEMLDAESADGSVLLPGLPDGTQTE